MSRPFYRVFLPAIKDLIIISSVRHQNLIPDVNFLLFELAPSNFHQGNILASCQAPLGQICDFTPGGPAGARGVPPGGLMAKSFICEPILLKFSPWLHIRKLLKDFS